jgi:peptide/nickel transport system substrate-binding protein
MGGLGSNAATRSGSVIQQLRIGTTFTPSSIDPTKALNANILDQLSLDTLLTVGTNNQLEPNLATSWKQTSPVTYVYHLRHGVKFWDGTTLTATDVAYSLNYEGRPGNVGAFGRFADFRNATATDPYTVEVRLSQPNASWEYTPAFPEAGIFEKAYAVSHGSAFGTPSAPMMASGPWKVDSFDATTGAQFSANPDWWGGPVNVENLSVTYFSSETSLALAMRSGQIDFDPFTASPKTFASTSGVNVITSPNSCSVGFFAMNVQTKPWSDVHVRRAVAYALNRADIIAANGGYAQPYYTFIPAGQLAGIASQPQIKALLSSVPSYKYNLAKAKQELASSAYPQGFSATMLDYSLGNSVNDIEVVDSELAQIGIKITPKIVPLSTWLANVGGVPASNRSTTFNLGGCSSPDASGYDSYLTAANLKQGQYNLAAYAPAYVDQWLKEGAAGGRAARRFSLYSNVIKQMAADVPYVPLFTADYSVAISSKFSLGQAYAAYLAMQMTPYPLHIKSVA